MGKLTQYDYLKGDIFLFNKQKEELTQKIKLFCQNKEYPLNERWNLFIDSNLGGHSEYCKEFKGIDCDLYYDDFYIEKYEMLK
jgi:hypothetical protein